MSDDMWRRGSGGGADDDEFDDFGELRFSDEETAKSSAGSVGASVPGAVVGSSSGAAAQPVSTSALAPSRARPARPDLRVVIVKVSSRKGVPTRGRVSELAPR